LEGRETVEREEREPIDKADIIEKEE